MITATPLMTEKSYTQSTKGVYAFRVPTDLDKWEIAELIERQYGVKVSKVRTVKMAGKTKRVGKTRTEVRIPMWKKAYIELGAGQNLDIYPIHEEQPAVSGDKE